MKASSASRRSFCPACVILALLLGATPLAAAEPLLIPGKRTLYQRVLTRPDTPLVAEAGDTEAIETFPPFEVFYVFERKDLGGAEYLRVGRSLEGGAEGWIADEKAIDWKQAIVLGFNNPANRKRGLIFKSREELEATLAREDVTERLDVLREEAVAGSPAIDSPIVSIEPAEFVDIEEEFYVLPILEAHSVRLPTGLPAQVMQIASVPERTAPAAPAPVDREEALRNFRIGVTFVIDTTISMQPYIDEVQAAMTRLRDRIAGSPEADRFRFGLVAFRDNVQLVPELEYVTKVVLPLDETSTADRFVTAIDGVKAATISSKGFTEDSIGGIMTAVDGMNWEPFGGRFVVLITDAGPLQPGPEAGRGDLAPAEVQQLMEKQKGTALLTLHLRTESGAFDHEPAEAAYRRMSVFNGSASYFPIEGGSRENFGRQVDALGIELEEMVAQAMDGQIEELPAPVRLANDIADSAGRIGRAMQLAYLGTAAGTRAPDVFEGWLTDRDALNRRLTQVTTPYLLMSKNELSTLRDVVGRAIDLGTDAVQDGSSDDFFNRLREAVALMSRTPEAVQDAGTLGDILAEYLDDLPYRSEITGLTPEDWRDMSPIRERQLLDTLRSKLAALERLHGDTARWHPLKPGAPAGEDVTVVPLTLMP